MAQKIIIIGAGLTGLTTAYLLQQKGISIQILEARKRIGGRIKTIQSPNGTPMEMGATWLGKKHEHLVALLQDLNIEIFQQYTHGIAFFETMSFAPPQEFLIPSNEDSSFRIKGGTSSLIQELTKRVGKENILLENAVASISKQAENISLKTSDGKIFTADKVISTLPPKLFAQHITCSPSLAPEVHQVMQTTQTWMENSIKFAVEYATPFWREKGWSGAVFSQSSIIPEMYDHTNFEENKFALKGFLNGSMAQRSKEEREKAVIQNLQKFFGEASANYVAYFDEIWETKPFTFSETDGYILPHQNNGHAVYQKSYLQETLYFAGTETAQQYGGYMEGAVRSAEKVVKMILEKLLS